jgi:cytochrome P450
MALELMQFSDTTASTLTHTFYHLARDPEQVDRLRREIAPQIDSPEVIALVKLQHLDHLNGIINETLRLHPPVPTAIPRLTPPEGIWIEDIHVPGDITVWCPPYTIGRSTIHHMDASRTANGVQVKRSTRTQSCLFRNVGIRGLTW